MITAMKKIGMHHQIPSEEMSSVAIDLKNLATPDDAHMRST
jgi:hypothetical protein